MGSQRMLNFLDRHRFGIAIALAAVLLRTHRLSEVFGSSDAADLASTIVKRVCEDTDIGDALSELALFRLGGIQPIVVYLHAALAQAFGFSLDAQAWVGTTIVVSALSVFCAYLLGAELVSTAAGLWAGTLLAVSPIHLMLGRHLGAPWAYEILFQLLVMFLLVKQIRKPSFRYMAALCVSLAFYMWCGNQMMAIFPVIGFGAIVGYWEGERNGPIAYVRSRFLSAWLLVPLASLSGLLWVTYKHREGHLAHALFDKRKEVGWHLLNWFNDLFRDIGQGPTWIGLLCLCLALASWKDLRTLRGLPAIYFLCYAVPFWIWISRKTTLTTGYVVYSITALLLITALAPLRALASAPLRHVIPMFSAALLFLGACSSVYGQLGMRAYLGVRGFQGSYGNEMATTAAAAFIRQRSGNDRSGVFSDASGGTGLEPPIMRLYFRRPSYSVYDAASPHVPYRKFKRRKDDIDYLVVQPENERLVGQYFGTTFHLAAKVIGGRKRDLYVYTRDAPSEIVTLQAEDGHRLYAKVYPELCSR